MNCRFIILPTLLSLFFVSFVAGQTYEFEGWYNQAEIKIAAAKENHFRKIVVYTAPGESDSERKVYSEEVYDTTGNILKSIVHQYRNFKDYEETYYAYDENSQLITITGKSTFSDEYYYQTKIAYRKDGKVRYMMSNFAKDGNFKYDTLFYSYNKNGKIRLKFFGGRTDTIFYHYNPAGELLNTSRSGINSDNNQIRNANGCVIGNEDTTKYKNTYSCDSLCNMISAQSETKIKGKWVITSKGEFKYSGVMRVEEKYYDCDLEIQHRCKGILVLNRDVKYEYNEKGFITQTIRLDADNKIIEIRKYVYETW